MKKKDNIVRYTPDTNGLTNEQVAERIKNKLVNKTKIVVGKSYFEIIMTNVFSFFNILLFIIAGFMIWGKYYTSLFFLVILACNIILGLYQDIKARVLMSKLRVVTSLKANVTRNGEHITIPVEDIVLDDVITYAMDSQISADCVILEGNCMVNESLLTGESISINKTVGDTILSGSYVTSGSVIARADKIGKYTYVESIQSKAQKFRRSPSQILKSLGLLFKILGGVVIAIAGATIGVYYAQGQFDTIQSFQEAIGPISGSLVSMIPAGLYLLTSTALAVGVISLAKRKAHVQDFYSIEMLSRSNVLCVDKTGTITDGTMSVKKIIAFGNHKPEDIDVIVANILEATNDQNLTAKALRKYFTMKATKKPIKVFNFSSDTKYSGAVFTGSVSYIMGAPEFINLTNKGGILKRCEEFTEKGLRVLVVATQIDEIDTMFEPVGLIVLQDHIKEDAPKTFEWFKNNGVEIKVVSGDNVQAVSEIARQAHIENADQCISLEGLTPEEVKEAATKYTVFGRVSPEQKEIIVQALKEAKKTVAMTGDGVNDILSLKRADCSIAMASGAEAARNVSHIVLLDSNFARLPDVVGEGRRVVNNLQRTAALFLVKTLMTITVTIAFLIVSLCQGKLYKFPFSTNNIYIWECITVGLSAFFLALEKNQEAIKGKFLPNVFKKAIPGALLLVSAISVIYLGAWLQQQKIIYTGIETFGFSVKNVSGATAMAVIAINVLSIPILLEICLPFDKYRRVVFSAASFLVVAFLAMFALLQNTPGEFKYFIKVNFSSLTGVNYIYVLVVVGVVGAIYLFVNYVAKQLKKEN